MSAASQPHGLAPGDVLPRSRHPLRRVGIDWRELEDDELEQLSCVEDSLWRSRAIFEQDISFVRHAGRLAVVEMVSVI